MTERLCVCWEQLVFVTFDFIHVHVQRVSLLYCIPAMSRWGTYRRCCSLVEAELEPWLRSGCEGLLAPTVTRYTKYVEFIVS